MNDADLHATLTRLGLQAYFDRIAATRLPCIWLQLGEAGAGGTGESRLFGEPDLPADMPWPTGAAGQPLAFLLQFDLAAVPRTEGIALPPVGLLSFFVAAGGEDMGACDIQHAVLHTAPDAALVARQPPKTTTAPTGFTMFAGRAPHRLILMPGVDFPRWATQDHEAICEDMSQDEQTAYSDDFRWALDPEGDDCIGKLFGHVAGIGSDPRGDAVLYREMNPKDKADQAKRWKLSRQTLSRWHHLLTIDSSDKIDLTIWDAGYLQFLARDTDLAAMQYGHIYAQIESS